MSLLVLFVVFGLVRGFDDQDDFGFATYETVPESYVLNIVTDIDGEIASFTGLVDIQIEVKFTTSLIRLNAKDLVLNEILVTDKKTNRNIKVNKWNYSEEYEKAYICLDQHVIANRKYTISIRFEGLLRDDDNGFFKSYYTSISGEKKWLAVTQFKTMHARSAFPCYDEPHFRTPFNITLKRKRNQIALSNMPVLKTFDVMEHDYQNWTLVYFMQTPSIPTYLVSFVVGEFECLDCRDGQNFIDVYSHLGNLYQTEYIAEAASELLETMENYTGIKYDLPKLNLLAVPQLGLGSTQSWGLNIYREKSILVDRNTKMKTRVSAKRTTEHVMAQQWFGNLVTPVRWYFAWLSDGFATYFEYFATATLEPDWRLEHFFVVEIQQPALEYDQIERYLLSVTKPEEIDRKEHGKSAAVLRMLKSWVGEETFKKALNIYLTRNRYKVVKTEHLWNAFETAFIELKQQSLCNKSVHTVMNPWTLQAGYPVVNVEKENKRLVLTQNRFLVETRSKGEYKWFIRLSYTTSKDKNFDTETTPSVWLDPNVNETTVPVTDDDVEWHIFNVQSTGFYRVNYTEENWWSLVKQLNDSPTVIHVLNRAQLIDDSFNLARARKLNYAIPLEMTRYLEKEDDVVPWFSAMNSLNYVLDRMRRGENGYADVKDFIGRLAGIAFLKVHRRVSREKNLKRPTIYIGWNAFSKWACKLDNKHCVKTALDYFRKWRNGEEIPADIKDAAFCTGVKYGVDDGNWNAILALYKSTRSFSEKQSALEALACTENAQLLRTHLNLILENGFPIEPQDYDDFFNALSSTPAGINVLISFLRRNFAHVVDNVKHGENIITSIYSSLASKVSTKDEVAKMTEIVNSESDVYKLKKQLRTLYYDEIEDNDKWFGTNSITISEFIKPGSTITTSEATITTQNPSNPDSNASSRAQICVYLLQMLTLSVTIKLYFNII